MAFNEYIGWAHSTEQSYEDGWRVTLTNAEEEALMKTIQEWNKVVQEKKKQVQEKTFQEEDDLFTI